MTSVDLQVSVSSDELALLRELLERERGDLPGEIRRTRAAQMRQTLQQRLRQVDHLLERFEVTTG